VIFITIAPGPDSMTGPDAAEIELGGFFQAVRSVTPKQRRRNFRKPFFFGAQGLYC
jgi:hypothetical protein